MLISSPPPQKKKRNLQLEGPSENSKEACEGEVSVEIDREEGKNTQKNSKGAGRNGSVKIECNEGIHTQEHSK
jgi:hypothetical protein